MSIKIDSFLTESPRWLMSKGREAAAYRIVFNKKCDIEFDEKMTSKAKEAEQEVLNLFDSLLLSGLCLGIYSLFRLSISDDICDVMIFFFHPSRNDDITKTKKNVDQGRRSRQIKNARNFQRIACIVWATKIASNGIDLSFHMVCDGTFILCDW